MVAPNTLVNFALVQANQGYSSSATSIDLITGDGAKLPSATPYQLTWWNSTDYSNAIDDPYREIIRVDTRSTDTLNPIVRGQGGTSAQNHNLAGKTYKLALSITADLVDYAGLSVFNVKEYGATGDGVTDDTVAIRAAVTDVNNAGHGVLFFPTGTYIVLSSDLNTLMSFTNVNDLWIISYGAKLKITKSYSVGQGQYIIALTSCKNINIIGWQVESTSLTTTAATAYGPVFCRAESAVENLHIGPCYLTSVFGGLTVDGYPSISKNIKVDFMRVKNSFYGVNCGDAGDNLVANIDAEDVARSYFVYGVKNHDVIVNSKDQKIADCVIAALHTNQIGCTNIRLKYRNHDSQDCVVNSRGVQVQFRVDSAAPVANVHRNIFIDLDIVLPNTGNRMTRPFEFLKIIEDGSLDTSDRGHILRNFRLSGYIEGQSNQTGAAAIYQNVGATWGTGDYWDNIVVRDLKMVNTDRAFFRLEPVQNIALFENIISDADWDVTGPTTTARAIFRNFKGACVTLSTSDTSEHEYINCHFTDNTQQSVNSKKLINTTVGSSDPNTDILLTCVGDIRTGSPIAPQDTNAKIYSGSGSPEGVVTADPGSLYLNTAGGTDTAAYLKESGTGNTGWAGIST